MHNPNLRDLSNRQGLRESKALNDLKCFVKEAVLPPLEKYRRKIREKRQSQSLELYLDSQNYSKYKEIMHSEIKIKNEIKKVENSLSMLRRKTKTLNVFKNALKSRLNDINRK